MEQSSKSRGKQRVVDAHAEAEAKKKDSGISEAVKDIVRRCLQVEPAERPDVNQLVEMVEDVIAGMPEDGDTMDD